MRPSDIGEHLQKFGECGQRMPRDHPIEMGQAGLDTGLDRSVPRLSTMRVHPDHRVREQLELPHLFTKQPRVATLPAIAGDHHDGAASQLRAVPNDSGTRRSPHPAECLPTSRAPAVQLRPAPRQPGAPEGPGLIRVSRVPMVKTSTWWGTARTIRCASRSSESAYGCIEPDMSINSTIRRRRTPGRRRRSSGQLARRTQLGTQRTSQVDRAATMRSASQRAAQRRHDVEASKSMRELGSLLLGEPLPRRDGATPPSCSRGPQEGLVGGSGRNSTQWLNDACGCRAAVAGVAAFRRGPRVSR